MVEFRKFTEFPRATLYDILQDAYSFDMRNRELWNANWHESDTFFMIIQRLRISTEKNIETIKLEQSY